MVPEAVSNTIARPRVAIALAGATLLLPALFVLTVPHPLEQPLGVDIALYREAAARWFAGGSFYDPRQLAGAYEVTPGDILYPPVGLWLFVPFAILPTIPALVLWWAIPAAVTVWAVVRLRPRPEVWPLIALCLAWPTTPLKIWTGNPVIWSVAAMAIATAWRGAAPFSLLKPSLFPFALFGLGRGAWWIGLAVFIVLCLPFGSLWVDWVTTVVDSRGGGLFYSILEAPMLALPLVAWIGRRTSP
jgi:hypothetical protein